MTGPDRDLGSQKCATKKRQEHPEGDSSVPDPLRFNRTPNTFTHLSHQFGSDLLPSSVCSPHAQGFFQKPPRLSGGIVMRTLGSFGAFESVEEHPALGCKRHIAVASVCQCFNLLLSLFLWFPSLFVRGAKLTSPAAAATGLDKWNCRTCAAGDCWQGIWSDVPRPRVAFPAHLTDRHATRLRDTAATRCIVPILDYCNRHRSLALGARRRKPEMQMS